MIWVTLYFEAWKKLVLTFSTLFCCLGAEFYVKVILSVIYRQQFSSNGQVFREINFFTSILKFEKISRFLREINLVHTAGDQSYLTSYLAKSWNLSSNFCLRLYIFIQFSKANMKVFSTWNVLFYLTVASVMENRFFSWNQLGIQFSKFDDTVLFTWN